MKKLARSLFIFTFLALPSLSYSGDYDMPDAATMKARIAALHPDFAEHLEYVYKVAGKKLEPLHIFAGLGLDIHDYTQDQEGFGANYNVAAMNCLTDVFIRKLLAEHPEALEELEELVLEHGKPAITRAVMITMPSREVLEERLGRLKGMLKIPHVLALAEKKIEVMEFAAAFCLDFYALAKSAGDNIFVKRSIAAVFLLRDIFLKDLIQGETEGLAKLRRMGVLKGDD